MSNKIDINIKVLWYLIPLLVISFIISVIVLNKHTANVFEEYPLLKSNEGINTIIIEPDVFKGTTLIRDSKGKNISVRAFNLDIKPNVLFYHLEKGDSIARKSNSDTLYLYKKNDGSVIKFEVQCLE
jgi:hypothetical protein